MTLDEKVPRVNLWALERYVTRELRFGQFYVDGEPYLRLSPSSHASIVESFVDECERKKAPVVKISDFERAKQNNLGIPPLRIGRYEAVGFGFLNDPKTPNKIVFTGSSSTYHLGPSKEHIQKVATYFPDWRFEIV